MGVLNVTPDSFSDGALYVDTERAVEYALQMLNDGADIVDVGGESTRPGARVIADENASEHGSSEKRESQKPVSEQEELSRVIPVIRSLKQKRADAIISVDTYKANVARAAVAAGAEIVNDVSGFRWDKAMVKMLASLNCGGVLMHMRGRPEEWPNLPPVQDMVMLIKRELRERTEVALLAGIKRERLVLDPGFRVRQEV